MRKIFIILIISMVVTLYFETGFAKIPVPERTESWINDYAGIIDAKTKKYLEDLIFSIEQKTPEPVELIIATFKSLEGWKLENFAREYGEKWRMVKRRKRDNGVILLVALKERRVTIGVGQNLKGILPDSVINNIIQNTITPEFGKGRYSEGIKKGTETIVSILNEAEIPRGWPLFNKRNLLIVFIIMLVLFLARRYFSHPTPFPK